MSNVLDRQTYVFSFNFSTLIPSVANVPIALRFRADEMVLKSITYAPSHIDGEDDYSNVVQIWCSKTLDQLIGSFSNGVNLTTTHDAHFRLSNSLQNENITFQFQTTADSEPSFSNPQNLISPLVDPLVPGDTKGIMSMTVEFLKLRNKEIY